MFDCGLVIGIKFYGGAFTLGFDYSLVLNWYLWGCLLALYFDFVVSLGFVWFIMLVSYLVGTYEYLCVVLF